MKAFLVFCFLVLALCAERPLVLFASTVGTGHIEPLIQLSKELKTRGVDTLFTCLLINGNFTEMRDYIQKNGETCVHLGSFDLPPMDMSPVKSLVGAIKHVIQLQNLIGSANEFLYRSIDDILSAKSDIKLPKKPAVIVYEIFSVFAGDVALKHSIPGVLVDPSMSYVFGSKYSHPLSPSFFVGSTIPKTFFERWIRSTTNTFLPLINLAFYWNINQVRKELGLEEYNVFDIDEVTGKRQHLFLETAVLPFELARHLSPVIQSVGPFVQSRGKEAFDDNLSEELKAIFQESKTNGQKIIYVTFGSTWEPNEKVTQSILQAAREMKDVRFIWARGSILAEKYGIELNEEDKKKIYLGKFLPQKAILSQETVKAVVTHCGMGGVGESIFFQKPLLGIPLGADQYHVAERIADAGVGLIIDDASITHEEVKEKLERLLIEPDFDFHVRKAKRVFELAGGVGRAADLLEFVIQFGNPEFLVPFYEKLPWWQRCNLDTTFASGVLLLAFWFLCRRCCGKKNKVKKE